MILCSSLPVLYLLFSGCNNEPEYNLSQIPVAEDAPQAPRDNPMPPAPEGTDDRKPVGDAIPPGDEIAPGAQTPAPPTDGFQGIANNDCIPPYEQKVELSEENSVTVSLSLDSRVLGQDLMVDLIQSEHGELKYGVTCKGTAFSFQAPKMLGSVRLAVFIDADQNGPTKNDTQGVTDPFLITDQPVTVSSVEWGTGPLSYYDFSSNAPTPLEIGSDTPDGEY